MMKMNYQAHSRIDRTDLVDNILVQMNNILRFGMFDPWLPSGQAK